MNTTDIRDTQLTQKIFWVTAVPLTVVILALAFLYGYRWDDIYKYLGDKWEERRLRMVQNQTRERSGHKGQNEQPNWRRLEKKLRLSRENMWPDKAQEDVVV